MGIFALLSLKISSRVVSGKRTPLAAQRPASGSGRLCGEETQPLSDRRSNEPSGAVPATPVGRRKRRGGWGAASRGPGSQSFTECALCNIKTFSWGVKTKKIEPLNEQEPN